MSTIKLREVNAIGATPKEFEVEEEVPELKYKRKDVIKTTEEIAGEEYITFEFPIINFYNKFYLHDKLHNIWITVFIGPDRVLHMLGEGAEEIEAEITSMVLGGYGIPNVICNYLEFPKTSTAIINNDGEWEILFIPAFTGDLWEL